MRKTVFPGLDLNRGVFTPRGFDFYTPDNEVLSALSLDKSALTEERENTGVILLRGQTLGFANSVDVRYDFYLGRLHSVRYLTMVARLRNPFLRIIATPFEHIAGKKDDVALVWATELFSKVLMQGEQPTGITVSDKASLSDGSFFTEHARWQLAQLRDHIYTLTITAPDGRILTLSFDTAQNPPR